MFFNATSAVLFLRRNNVFLFQQISISISISTSQISAKRTGVLDLLILIYTSKYGGCVAIGEKLLGAVWIPSFWKNWNLLN
jgi:hypothetical protein